MTVRFPTVPPRLYGEVAVASALDALGFVVNMRGGTRSAVDGDADRDGLHLLIQVKATVDGYPTWQHSGDKARVVAERAESVGRIGIFAWVVGERQAPYMLDNGDVVLPRHASERIYAATAEQFAADVDRGRAEYAEDKYVRAGRHGSVGERRNPNGCRFSVGVEKYPSLEQLISDLSQI